jgi:phosphate transport system substrate-binding protein
MHAKIPRRSATLALVASLIAFVLPASAQDVLGETGVKGAGSTLIYPLLSRWSQEHRTWLAKGGEFPAPNAGLEDPPATSALEYEPIGSLAGTLRLKDRAVDFAASDMPLSPDELAKLGLGQFPIAIGGVVVAVNVDGVGAGKIKLTGALLARIFLGKIARWSDPAIKERNPGLALPDAPIAVIFRSDGSGTTFTFADYLSKASGEYKEKPALRVSWPVGKGAKGNQGVAQAVKSTKNSIGYVDHAHASEFKLNYALLQNRSGRFVKPNTTTFKAAASSGDWKKSDFHVLLGNAPGENSYPITATVFALMHKNASSKRNGAALDFFRWSLRQGTDTASRLGYVPLPPEVVELVGAYWKKTFGA